MAENNSKLKYFRQKRNKENPRNRRLNVRLTEDEYITISKKAEKLNIKPGEYAYCLLTQKEVRVQEISRLLRLVASFSNNMNQIARYVNGSHSLDSESASEFERIRNAIYAEIDNMGSNVSKNN